jgi:HK97 family phage major capsid protein
VATSGFGTGVGPQSQFVSGWIPVEYGAQVIQKVTQHSAVETYGQQVLMTSQSRYVARDGGVVAGLVQKGSTYGPFSGGQAGTSDNTDDSVLLTAGKWGTEIDIAEEDIMDSLADIINSKSNAIGTALAKVYDNVSIGVNAAPGAANANTTSIYWGLTHADANTGYSANANVVATAANGHGIPTYANLSQALGFVETGDYFNEEDMICVAHPFFRNALRQIVDNQGRPIFNESSGGFPGGGQGATPDLIFRIPVFWSLGAAVTTAPTSAIPAAAYGGASGTSPAGTVGNRLLVFCNRVYALAGKRTTNPNNPAATPEFQIVPPMYSGTDTTVLRGRMRRAFSVGTEYAFSLVEGTQ